MLDLANELSAPASQTRKCGRAMGQTVRQVVSGEASSEAGEVSRQARGSRRRRRLAALNMKRNFQIN